MTRPLPTNSSNVSALSWTSMNSLGALNRYLIGKFLTRVRFGLPIAPRMPQPQNLDGFVAQSVDDQKGSMCYDPFARAGGMARTANLWMIRQGMGSVPKPLGDSMRGLRLSFAM